MKWNPQGGSTASQIGATAPALTPAKSFLTIRGNDRGGPRPPLAPPEYRGGRHATLLFIPPLYSGGARGGRPTIDLWRLAFVKVFPRIVKRDLEHLTFGWMEEHAEGKSIPPLYSGGLGGCLLRNREVL